MSIEIINKDSDKNLDKFLFIKIGNFSIRSLAANNSEY